MVNVRGRERRPAQRKAAGFVYRERSADAVKKRAERKGGRFDSIFKQSFDSWRPKVGANRIRILPPTWDDFDHYGFRIFVHRFIGPDNSTYLCPSKMLNKKCPICAAVKETRDAGEEEEAKRMSAVEQFVYWVLDRDEKDPSPELTAFSWTMDRDIAKLTIDDRTGKILLIDHPDDGFDLTFDRDGQGMKTRYSAYRIDRESSPISEDEAEQEEVLSLISKNPIPDCLQYYPPDYLQRMLDGTASEKDEDLDEEGAADEDEEETPKRKVKAKADGKGRRDEDEEEEERPRRKARARDDEEEAEDESEDEPAEDESEEEAEEEAPRRKSRRAADDEEEEEEEQPRRKARARDEEEEVEDEPAEDESEDETEEEEEPPRRKAVKRRR